MLLQMLPQNLTFVTPTAGRPGPSQRAGAGKEEDMKPTFSKILKRNTGTHTGGVASPSWGRLWRDQ